MNLIERASDFLRGTAGVRAAYVFGSVAADRAHRESDLDLAVLLDWRRFPDRASRGLAQVELLSSLIQNLHKNEIDLVVLNDAPPLLSRRVLREGRRIVSTDDEAVHSFERDVQLRAADLEPFIMRARARLLGALAR